jgi:DNA-binding SARP family transcriptional activator/WD40 repeat protein
MRVASAPSTRSLSFGVLGPLMVLDGGGGMIALGGPKERAVLARLLASANQVVQASALVESLWGDDPPRSAERSLQAYVARLRSALEPDRVEGTASAVVVRIGGGYQLRIEVDQLDSLRFEALARRGRHEVRDAAGVARATLREALGLWRGEAFGEFSAVEACEAEGRRLEELRVVAIEDLMDAELAAGATSGLVAELEGLVARHEFRERLRAQLMLALYRSGRQRDALAAYRRARVTLTEQLGLEPGRELRELEAAILEQDPALDLRPPGAGRFGLPAPLESVGPAFVGRDAELAWLRTAWVDAADGRGGFVSVLGPEGIGKTRLTAELAREVQRAGGVVLYARSGAGASGIRALLDGVLDDAGGSVDVEPTDELGSAVVHLLATGFGGRPVLLVVDDVHLADDDTVEVLADLAGWSTAGPLLVVAAFRTDVDAAGPVVEQRGGVSAHLVLSGLDRTAMQRVCEMYAPDGWSPDDLDRLQELTGGVPSRVHELASDWAEERARRDVGAAADRSATVHARLAALRAEIAQSVEGIQHVLEQRRANSPTRRAAAAMGTLAAVGRNPYKGLAAFQPGDADEFFGRERLVAELIARLASARVLTVVGASGCGKSSLVRAGLLPALAAGVLPVDGGWRTSIETPNARRDPAGAPGSTSTTTDGRRLLFVDQFEELFTTGFDHAAQLEYVDRLAAAAGRTDTVAVIAIRADHLEHCATFTALAELMAGNDVLVGPMTDIELRRAIELPARRAGATFEPGVVDEVIADVAGRPGALPLLSTALAETWQRRVDNVLTHHAYTDSGGVDGALAGLAEETFAVLDGSQRLAVRRLLLRLCSTPDGTSDVRRRVPLTVVPTDDDTRQALAALVDRRLVVVDHDTVEVAHEALLREWPRLRTWMDEDVQGRRLHARISDATQAWTAADGDPSELYRGTRLDSALDWAGTHQDDLDAAERAFLDASADDAARELDDARRRARDKSRTNRRLRWSLAALSAVLIVAVLAGVLFVRQRDRAERSSREASARELSAAATTAISEDPELAMLLGLEAVRATEGSGAAPLPEAISALQQATQSSRLLWRQPDGAGTVDASPDGAIIATGSASDPGAILIWNASSRELERTITAPNPTAGLRDLQFSPDGHRLAAVYDHDAEHAVVLWDPIAGRDLAVGHGRDNAYWTVAFSPDGHRVVTTSEIGGGSNRISIWDAVTGAAQLEFRLDQVWGSVFSPDGATVLVAEHVAERIGIYSAADGSAQATIPTPGFQPDWLAIHAATGMLAISSQDSRKVQIRELGTGFLRREIDVADVGPVDWSMDGARLAIAGANQREIRIVDVASGLDTTVLRGHSGGSWDADLLADGERLASVSVDGDLLVWDVSDDGPPALHAVTPTTGTPRSLRLSPDGTQMVLTTTAAIERHAVATGELLSQETDQLVGNWHYPAPISPDWRFIASTRASDGVSTVRRLAGSQVIATLPTCTTPVGFSSDGAMIGVNGGYLCVLTDFFGRFRPPPRTDLHSRLIETASGREILDLGNEPVVEVIFNPPGQSPADRYLAVNVDLGRVDIYDVVTRRRIASLPVEEGVYYLSFDSTGRWLVATTSIGRVFVLDMRAVVAGTPADKAITRDFIADGSGVAFTAISADGTLATAGRGQALRLWNLATGELNLELHIAHTTGAPWIAFDRRSDLFYSDGRTIRRYPNDPNELVDLARSLLTRQLTPDECLRYLHTECAADETN